jgi:hypothetical protein
MSHMHGRAFVVAAFGISVAVSGHASTEQGPGAMETRVAALKQSLQENQAQLRKYEWIETTIVNLKGEEKDRKQQRCYYGVDGKVQKVLLDEQKAAPPQGGRLKQRIVAKKTGEMKDYMESAATLIQRYVPPNPADIDSARKREKVALRPGQGGVVRLEFTDYIKPGDLLAVDVDAAGNRLVGISVNTYLDTPDDAVTLNVGFATLPDGTSYTAQTTLDAKAKNITVVVQKSGYRPVGR